MFNNASGFDQIYIVCGYTDLRRGIDGLSAIIQQKFQLNPFQAYSIAETAKANNLKPYQYFKHLLTEMPKHEDDKDLSFIEDLLPWSDKLPAECKKQTNL